MHFPLLSNAIKIVNKSSSTYFYDVIEAVGRFVAILAKCSYAFFTCATSFFVNWREMKLNELEIWVWLTRLACLLHDLLRFFLFWVISRPYIITSKLRGYYLVVKVLVQLVATELERLEFFTNLMYFNLIHQVSK